MKINNHLVTLTEWKYWEVYEEYEYLGGALTYLEYNAYDETLSKEEFDQLCAKMSGEVNTYNVKSK